MADAVDEYEAAQANPQPEAHQSVSHDEVPTEPATSPRSQIVEVPVHSRSRGGYTQMEWDAYLRSKRQADSDGDMERERQRAQTAEHDAHQRSIQEWEAQVKARELDNAAIPCGPPPAGTSSMRVLPDVHEALRQNDPKTTSYSQPAVKKAPPTTGRPRPCAFYSDTEPPRIGAPVQPPPPAVPRPSDAPSGSLLLAATPMTPGHPPRPPIDALPKHPSMEMSSGANKHPLEPPTAQAPTSKHVRCKAFPQSSQPPDQVSICSS